jgi:hypothetical protein
MCKLHLITGSENIECFEDFQERVQDINIDSMIVQEFSTQKDKTSALNLIYKIKGNYLVISEDEFNLIVN